MVQGQAGQAHIQIQGSRLKDVGACRPCGFCSEHFVTYLCSIFMMTSVEAHAEAMRLPHETGGCVAFAPCSCRIRDGTSIHW